MCVKHCVRRVVVGFHIMDHGISHLAFCHNRLYVGSQNECFIVKPVTVHVILRVGQCFV
jgi:hypothetical protein